MPHPDEGTIHAWLDGELPVDEAAALEEHLGTCDECIAHVAEARGLIAGSARIMGILDEAPGGVIPGAASGAAPSATSAAARASGSSGLTSLGELLTAPTGEGPSVKVYPPEVVQARARRPWWMSNQIRAAAAVVLVLGGVMLSWGRLNKGEVALKDSAQATPPFVAAVADTFSPAGVKQAPAPTIAAADANAATTGAQTPTAATTGTPGSRLETAAANTPAAAARRDSVTVLAERREEAASEQRGAAADANRRATGPVGDVSGVPSGVAAGARVDSAQAQAKLLAQRLERQRELDRQRSLAATRTPPPAELKKQAVTAQQEFGRSAASVAGAAAPAAAPPISPSTAAPSRDDVLRHPFAGCYTIQSASWSPPLTPAELEGIPQSFELDTLTATGGPASGRGLVHPRPQSVRARYEALFWQPDAGGRATVTMRGTQASLTLALAGGGTQGLALFSRTGGATSRSLITLTRSACR